MSVSVQTTIGITVREQLLEGGGSVQDRYNVSETTTYVDAAGALGATKQWNDQRTNATATESLDLAGGVTNRLGVVQTFTKVKGLFIWHRGTTGTLTIGGGANSFGANGPGGMVLRPEGKFLWVDESASGATVTPGTGDLLQIVGSASITYDIAIWGE